MVGLFSRTPKDPNLKENQKKFKEFKKLLKDKKYEKALKSGLELIRKVPNHQDSLFMIGSIYYMQKKYKTAISFLDRSLEIGEYDIDALLLKAYSHQKLGESKRILACCDKIKEIDPKNKPMKHLLEEL